MCIDDSRQRMEGRGLSFILNKGAVWKWDEVQRREGIIGTIELKVKRRMEHFEGNIAKN
jgi:hypothetical protein